MKHQARRFLSSHRFANSLHSTHLPRTRCLHTRVTQFSHHSSPSLSTRSSLSLSLLDLRSQIEKLPKSGKSEAFSNEILSENPGLPDSMRILHEDPKFDLLFYRWAAEENGFRSCSSSYNSQLKFCAINDGMKEFLVVVRRCKRKGIYIGQKTYLDIYSDLRRLKRDDDATELQLFYENMVFQNAIKGVAKMVAQNLDWGSELERKLGEMRIWVQENFVLGVLKELKGKGLPLKALSFFKWVGESLGFEHNNATYNRILRILCTEETIMEFWSIFEEMKDAGYVIDSDTYVEVMLEFQKSKMVKDAVELFEYRMDTPFKYLEGECGLLFNVISSTSNPDLDLMFRVVKKYEAAGYCLLKSDYEGIHRCLTSAGKFDEAEKIIQTMRRAGYNQCDVTYRQLIFGLCKAGRLEEACEVVDMMEAQGYIPGIKTWIALTKGYCDVNGVDKALPWFGILVKKGFDANAGLLDFLVYGFLKEKRVIGAYELDMEMVGKAHMIPWHATFRNLIEELLGERRLEEALNLLRLMMKQDYRPYREPFVQYISKFGSVEDAWEFLMALSKKTYPSLLACQRVFKSFFNEGRHCEAKELLLKCPDHISRRPAICTLFGSS
ncbi:pentatricopeptide repeat-containing protein At3g48250, chloroplastic-like [Coffea arabica]|uniref:Pentatricopeptide repeat-containing protein At3g48250, chloroplastic-like n=1 Tax=Coffea arabica TaxID=13443 RepID=A0A6P6XB03_COFAR